MKYLIAAALFALASGAASAAPVTAEGNSIPAVRVSFADLDLGGQAGIATLKARIRSAAGRLCTTYNVEPMAVKLSEKRCYRTTIANAYGQVDRLAAGHPASLLAAAALTVSAVR